MASRIALAAALALALAGAGLCSESGAESSTESRAMASVDPTGTGVVAGQVRPSGAEAPAARVVAPMVAGLPQGTAQEGDRSPSWAAWAQAVVGIASVIVLVWNTRVMRRLTSQIAYAEKGQEDAARRANEILTESQVNADRAARDSARVAADHAQAARLMAEAAASAKEFERRRALDRLASMVALATMPREYGHTVHPRGNVVTVKLGVENRGDCPATITAVDCWLEGAEDTGWEVAERSRQLPRVLLPGRLGTDDGLLVQTYTSRCGGEFSSDYAPRPLAVMVAFRTPSGLAVEQTTRLLPLGGWDAAGTLLHGLLPIATETHVVEEGPSPEEPDGQSCSPE